MANAPWYRTGTVAVTNGSTAVAGTQTLWTGQVAEGDIFKGPDGKDYEVASTPASNTALTLRTPYLGATAGAQSYAIVRNFTGTIPAELAASLAAMLAKWHISVDDFLAVLLDAGATSTINDATGTPRAVTSWAGILAQVGGRLSKVITGGTVALTAAEAGNKLLDFSGVLTSNAIATLDKTGVWAVSNGTTGNYTLTIKTATGNGVTIPQGGKVLIRSDGTNIALATDLSSLGAGSMATQNANAVAVTGGAVNGASVGAATPSTGAFTTLTGARLGVGVANPSVPVAIKPESVGGNCVSASSYAGGNYGGNGTYGLVRFTHGYWNVSQEVASIRVVAGSSTGGSGSGNAALALCTGTSGNGDVGTTSVERVTIDAVGNVGIGTTVPTAKLHVLGDTLINSSGSLQVTLRADNQDSKATLSILGTKNQAATGTVMAEILLGNQNGDGATGYAWGAVKAVKAAANNWSGDLVLYAHTSNAGELLERLRLSSSGPVGVNNASPAVTLDVGGVMRPASYTKATVPAASASSRGLVYVTDASGGASLAWSDGSTWTSFKTNVAI